MDVTAAGEGPRFRSPTPIFLAAAMVVTQQLHTFIFFSSGGDPMEHAKSDHGVCRLLSLDWCHWPTHHLHLFSVAALVPENSCYPGSK
jgi:hypothetical protein